jgi:hypothetical protein
MSLLLAVRDQSDAWVALAPAVFGLVLGAIVIAALREAAAMKRWPVAKGRVVSAKVEEYRESISRGTGGARDRMTLYRPVVRYKYEVAGERFEGNRIAQSPGFNRGVPDFAEAIVQRYAEGSEVEVRYNPKRPGECVLEPRAPRSWIFAAVLSAGLLAAAAWVYWR